jgi:competence protein ComFC
MENSEFDSKTKKLFWGRIPVEIGYSLLYFEKGNSTQKILHNIKYENKKKLTFEMGKKIGEKLKNTNLINEIDVLIPVPIHKNKKFERGYNQSYLLSKGISSVIKIETNNQLIFRKKNSKSQTRLNKFLRWENAQNTYSISTKFINQQINHIAIIDDVITTGSTIESISQEILKTNPNIKISVISLALAV